MGLLFFMCVHQDSEGFVVAVPGLSQCSGPQVPVGRVPLQQDSAQVPPCGSKRPCELGNNLKSCSLSAIK